MSSCTNSSNIRSTLLTQIIREESDGKRVAFKISSADVGISAGVTLGSVVRYDVATDSYMPSKADDAATAEVVGVVEKIDGGVYTIVASGLMIYPNINDVINSYTGGCTTFDGTTGGGSGGSDIFFLSDFCDGKLQLLEPTISGHIIKPVMQRVKVGPAGSNQYNGIVLNYIGYQVAELADSTYEMASAVGEPVYTKEKLTASDGFLDARAPQLLPVAGFSELYSLFGTGYGDYVEEVKIQPQGNLSSLNNATVIQKNTNGSLYSTGKVVSVDTTQNTINIKKTSNQPKTDLTKYIIVGTLKYKALDSKIISFTVPSVDNKTILYKTSDGETKEETLIPYIRARSSVTTVSLPKKLIIDEIVSKKIITGGFDVGTKLQDLENRVKDMERRYGKY